MRHKDRREPALDYAATKRGSSWLAAVMLAWVVQPVWAESDEDLQKKLANPVADIVTVPFQWTTNLGVGPYHRPMDTLNIQPVYPVKLDGGWSLINRVILPLVSTPAVAAGQDRKNGLGDINYQVFFSPAPVPGKLIWGAGPSLIMPTASDDRLGAGKWSLGPAVVGVIESGKWTAGALVTQVWSFAGDGNRATVSSFSLQPIASYRLDSTQSLGYLGTVTANWKEARASQRWTVPIGASYTLLVKPADFVPMNWVVGAGYNVIRPDGSADWILRLQVNFVLSK